MDSDKNLNDEPLESKITLKLSGRIETLFEKDWIEIPRARLVFLLQDKTVIEVRLTAEFVPQSVEKLKSTFILLEAYSEQVQAFDFLLYPDILDDFQAAFKKKPSPEDWLGIRRAGGLLNLKNYRCVGYGDVSDIVKTDPLPLPKKEKKSFNSALLGDDSISKEKSQSSERAIKPVGGFNLDILGI